MTDKIKEQLINLLWSKATQAHTAGSCGELGDSFMAIDSDFFSELADEILRLFNVRPSLPPQNKIDKSKCGHHFVMKRGILKCNKCNTTVNGNTWGDFPPKQKPAKHI